MGRVTKRCRCCADDHQGNSWDLCLGCIHAGCQPVLLPGETRANPTLVRCRWCGMTPGQRCRNPKTGAPLRIPHARRQKDVRERGYCRRLWPDGWRFGDRPAR